MVPLESPCFFHQVTAISHKWKPDRTILMELARSSGSSWPKLNTRYVVVAHVQINLGSMGNAHRPLRCWTMSSCLRLPPSSKTRQSWTDRWARSSGTSTSKTAAGGSDFPLVDLRFKEGPVILYTKTGRNYCELHPAFLWTV